MKLVCFLLSACLSPFLPILERREQQEENLCWRPHRWLLTVHQGGWRSFLLFSQGWGGKTLTLGMTIPVEQWENDNLYILKRWKKLGQNLSIAQTRAPETSPSCSHTGCLFCCVTERHKCRSCSWRLIISFVARVVPNTMSLFCFADCMSLAQVVAVSFAQLLGFSVGVAEVRQQWEVELGFVAAAEHLLVEEAQDDGALC